MVPRVCIARLPVPAALVHARPETQAGTGIAKVVIDPGATDQVVLVESRPRGYWASMRAVAIRVRSSGF